MRLLPQGRSDSKGSHGTMCQGGASRILRHNEIRNVLGKAFSDIGYTIAYEHGGGLTDGRKPCDIIVFTRQDGKHLLIDVAITNPLATSYHPYLLAGGPGRTAKHMEAKKIAKYRDLDTATYEFLPFNLETTGAFGPSARNLCKRLREIKDMKCCSTLTTTLTLTPTQTTRTAQDTTPYKLR